MTNKEIDERVAREVMGWYDYDREVIPMRGTVRPFVLTSPLPFPYSTDMNASMSVVNKIVGRNPECFSLEWDQSGEHRWFAVFIMDGDKVSSWACGDADTPAMAICLAALEAVKR